MTTRQDFFSFNDCVFCLWLWQVSDAGSSCLCGHAQAFSSVGIIITLDISCSGVHWLTYHIDPVEKIAMHQWLSTPEHSSLMHICNACRSTMT